jgi:hypothetical protein
MSLVRSKQRVVDHGEVFTPWTVEAMLNLALNQVISEVARQPKQTIVNVENGQQGFSLEVLEVVHGQDVDLNWLIAGRAKD